MPAFIEWTHAAGVSALQTRIDPSAKIGFATDYVYATQAYFLGNVSKLDVYPPEQAFGGPTPNIAAEHLWDVVAVLEDEYGWNEKDIRGFLGENLLRVYEANWN